MRQLGNVYEGLLVYHVVIPRDDWEQGFQRKGLRVALVPSNKERKSSGSYFTPQHIVKYIVANTVGPLLTEKFDALAPKLRPIQREYQETREFERKRAEKMRSQPRTDLAIALSIAVKHEKTVWDVFDLKVLDPAMGSGHFLVETVDFITDKVLDFLAGFPWNPVQVLIDQRIRAQIIESLDQQGVTINEDRLTDVNLIKRLVMKRCVYGVDIIRYVGARCNVSTGLHVHHHLPEVVDRPQIARSLQHLWWRFHPLMYGMLPPSRKSCHYCRPPQQDDATMFDSVGSYEALCGKLNRLDRYAGLNVANLNHGHRMTVEWRIHGGTTDWEKIRAWVLATQRWTEHAIARSCHYKPQPIPNTAAGLNALLVTTGLKTNSRVYSKVQKELREVGKFLVRRWKHFNIPLDYKSKIIAA